MSDLTQEQAAELAGVTTRRIRQLEKEDDPPPRLDSGYPAADFGQWLKRRHLAGIGITGDGEAVDFEAERARLTKAQADKTELEVARLRGEMLPAEDIRRELADMIGAHRAKLLQLPQRVPEVMAAATQVEAESRLRDMVYEALQEFADILGARGRAVLDRAGEGGGAASETDGDAVGRAGNAAEPGGQRGTRPL